MSIYERDPSDAGAARTERVGCLGVLILAGSAAPAIIAMAALIGVALARQTPGPPAVLGGLVHTVTTELSRIGIDEKHASRVLNHAATRYMLDSAEPIKTEDYPVAKVEKLAANLSTLARDFLAFSIMSIRNSPPPSPGTYLVRDR